MTGIIHQSFICIEQKFFKDWGNLFKGIISKNDNTMEGTGISDSILYLKVFPTPLRKTCDNLSLELRRPFRDSVSNKSVHSK